MILFVCLFLFRLWEAGWKGRYYQNKFQLSENDNGYDDFRKKVVRFYIIVYEQILKLPEKCLLRTRKLSPYLYRDELSYFFVVGRCLCGRTLLGFALLLSGT